MSPGTRVLIVEDDRSISRVVQMQLEHHGLTVLCCHDGISGLEAIPRFRPQLVVLDIMLPRAGRGGRPQGAAASKASRWP